MNAEQQILLFQERIVNLEKENKELRSEVKKLTEHNDALEKKIHGLQNNLREELTK